jgi:hypothetical protein
MHFAYRLILWKKQITISPLPEGQGLISIFIIIKFKHRFYETTKQFQIKIYNIKKIQISKKLNEKK